MDQSVLRRLSDQVDLPEENAPIVLLVDWYHRDRRRAFDVSSAVPTKQNVDSTVAPNGFFLKAVDGKYVLVYRCASAITVQHGSTAVPADDDSVRVHRVVTGWTIELGRGRDRDTARVRLRPLFWLNDRIDSWDLKVGDFGGWLSEVVEGGPVARRLLENWADPCE